MKKTVFSIAALMALAGCLSVPQTTQDLREMTPALVAKSTSDTAQSPSAVVATFARLGPQCLTYSRNQTWTRTGAAGGTVAVFNHNWRTKIERQGSVQSLVIEQYSPQDIGSPGWYPIIVADVTPKGSGSALAITAARGYGDFVNAITAWSQGNTRPCPVRDLA